MSGNGVHVGPEDHHEHVALAVAARLEAQRLLARVVHQALSSAGRCGKNKVPANGYWMRRADFAGDFERALAAAGAAVDQLLRGRANCRRACRRRPQPADAVGRALAMPLSKSAITATAGAATPSGAAVARRACRGSRRPRPLQRLRRPWYLPACHRSRPRATEPITTARGAGGAAPARASARCAEQRSRCRACGASRAGRTAA